MKISSIKKKHLFCQELETFSNRPAPLTPRGTKKPSFSDVSPTELSSRTVVKSLHGVHCKGKRLDKYVEFLRENLKIFFNHI